MSTSSSDRARRRAIRAHAADTGLPYNAAARDLDNQPPPAAGPLAIPLPTRPGSATKTTAATDLQATPVTGTVIDAADRPAPPDTADDGAALDFAERGVHALPADASPADRAAAEASWRPTTNPAQTCRCSGIRCDHGQQCPQDGCTGRLLHVDRQATGLLGGCTDWHDTYACTTGDPACEAESAVTLPALPWGERLETDPGTGARPLLAYAGVRHTQLPDTWPDGTWPTSGGSYCPECGADYGYQCNCGQECPECGGDPDNHYSCHCGDD